MVVGTEVERRKNGIGGIEASGNVDGSVTVKSGGFCPLIIPRHDFSAIPEEGSVGNKSVGNKRVGRSLVAPWIGSLGISIEIDGKDIVEKICEPEAFTKIDVGLTYDCWR